MSYGGFRRNDNFGPKPVETGKDYDGFGKDYRKQEEMDEGR